jgi:diaminopimelate epimerase
LTKACGSAACAAAVCGARTGRVDRKVVIELPGGALEIDWRADDHVIMTGPAEHEHDGVVDATALAEASRRDRAQLLTERA